MANCNDLQAPDTSEYRKNRQKRWFFAKITKIGVGTKFQGRGTDRAHNTQTFSDLFSSFSLCFLFTSVSGTHTVGLSGF